MSSSTSLFIAIDNLASMPLSKCFFFHFIHVIVTLYDFYHMQQSPMIRSITLYLQAFLPKARSDNHDAAVFRSKDSTQHPRTQTQTQDNRVAAQKKKASFLHLSCMAHDRPCSRHRASNSGLAGSDSSCEPAKHEQCRAAGDATAITDGPRKAFNA